MTEQNSEPEFDTETVDRLLTALSSDYCRGVVEYFHESPKTVATLTDVAEFVARERAGSGTDQEDRVAIKLHHADLPKLDGIGVLDYDPRTTTVRFDGHPVIERGVSTVAKLASDGESSATD